MAWFRARVVDSPLLVIAMVIALIVMLLTIVAIALYVAARPPSSEVPGLSRTSGYTIAAAAAHDRRK